MELVVLVVFGSLVEFMYGAVVFLNPVLLVMEVEFMVLLNPLEVG